ncbi:ester cyclase [Epibacterium ulvae]|uniref:ester cyclase n=1 Tax=Epibacterium ulvae TaxID=1156985 RepID=UPI0024933D05|nr:ester cyclase [Epibacterium ulvae]
MTTKTDLMLQYYRDVWENGELEKIESYFTPQDHDQYVVEGKKIVPSEIREWVSIIRSFVTDIKVTILQSVEEGDWLALMLRIDCLRVDTRTPVRVHQQIMFRFDGNLKAESYPFFDFLNFFEQLGQLPEDVHALLLAGTHLD